MILSKYAQKVLKFKMKPGFRLCGLARRSGHGSKVVVEKKEVNTWLRITETDLFNKRTLEGRRSVTIICETSIQKVACGEYLTNDSK